MEVLTEMDEYVNAMAKINLDEAVMPYVNGRLVESSTYNKVQKILNTPELEKAHVYCYDLDLDNLEESDVEKINNLYKLGVDRGFIDDDFQYQDVEETPSASDVIDAANKPLEKQAIRKCFVAMYSATKNGQIKTGEAYSNASDIDAAKVDIKSQLSKFGYSNIAILAIEVSDEPCCCDDCEDSELDDGNKQYANVQEADSIIDYFSEKDDDKEEEKDEDSEEDSEEDEEEDSDEDSDDSEESDDTDDSEEDDDVSDEEDDSFEDDEIDDGEDDTDDSKEEDDDTPDDEDSEDDDSNTEDDDSDEDEPEDDSDDSDNEDDDSNDKELDDNEKSNLKDKYKKVFKNVMVKCKFEGKSFDDLSINEKVKFFTELSKVWKDEYEPSDFMSDKEVDQLNKIVINK